ncbi:MAG: aspartate--ammonia ligase [Candidatus Aenigmatarchaeota archaeon]
MKEKYKSKIDFFETEKGIQLVKDTFEKKLAEKLRLRKVSAPKFLKTGTGLQDDLAGTQIPVGFETKFADARLEIVHSLAKWKRHTLGRHGFKHGTGLYTHMDAIRKDEDIDDTHSVFVDQWDWERVITKEERDLEFLKETVRSIYESILETKTEVEKEFPELKTKLPKKITFVHTEELEELYPQLSPKKREDKIAEKYGAVFLIGIGYPLKSGKPHDLRAADYDDWSTETISGKRGLNGDIIVWDEMRKKALELSSMGIRVDQSSLMKQLDFMGLSERKGLKFHKAILMDELPLTIGGGIGQSRLCMLLLHKTHIGEVQVSTWPEEVEKDLQERGVILL